MGSNSRNLQGLIGAPGVRGRRVAALPKDGLTDFIESVVLKRNEAKEPFYVLDLGVVSEQMDKWCRNLPMIQPFYAVKCNPEPALIGLLAALGANFDCASRAEIETVLSLGISPDQIIYANPCKQESHIKYAASVGVNLTTFDSKHELEKIRKWHPKCALLLRIKPSQESGARCQLGPKFGALSEEVVPLLKAAHAAKLTLSGVSFHIGSAATCPAAFRGAIEEAKSVFETTEKMGMPKMTILNIGGGFTGGLQFDEAAMAIKSALKAYFPSEQGLTIMSEPGRFFAESAFTLATTVIGKRVRGELREYWINDGIYGSMNCIIFDHATLTCKPLACTSTRAYSSTVFGPTCDALDTVMKDHLLPDLQVNDWLVFPNMGAYTAAAGSSFNGFNTSAILTHLAYSSL
ncbi:hypothetical protein K2173_027772 [Erythroxylum novogranatense]|uniref:ornithine decarboxylase n=1 Tax=Erythroxylum novogranatense TaxID=1862640 RepID=A0AAV8U2I7_9ROSI|nr:hypothetical protein K2173_027772 [Erythroxylum novogranatense]